MARILINSEEFSSRLFWFRLDCKECHSSDVSLDIYWEMDPGWINVVVVCEQCHNDETILYEAE